MEMKIEPLALPGVDTQRPIVIAGPCSAETEEQVLETAQGLASRGVKIFRAGIWKPRTKPGGFEGIGAEGLAWLKKVKKETGMLVSTEVATKDHVFEALKAGIDILWIGARTTVNPFAVQEIADALKGVDVPVLIKNPVNPDLELWIGAFERLYGAGIHRLGAIHRGFSSYDKKIYRNLPLWHIPIELRRRMPDLPIFCDPSHIGGKRELVAPLCQQAMDLSFDGLIVESHCNPDCAWSDASQQITPDVLDYVLNLLVIRDVNQTTENLTALRRQIDGIDIIWIGARTSANPFAMQALADSLSGVDIPVLVKNPINPDLELWIGAMERLNQAGIKRLAAIHRGFSSYDNKIYRNAPMWQIPIELRRRIPELPIICDPSHIGGRRNLIAPLSQQAMDLGFDGLIVETHCSPNEAWSDAAQQVTPDGLYNILSQLTIRDGHIDIEGIHGLREQIDALDNNLVELLSNRMNICRKIGSYKKEHNMTVLQANRYKEIIDKRGAQGELFGMDSEFVKHIFELVHEESVRQQMEVINKQ